MRTPEIDPLDRAHVIKNAPFKVDGDGSPRCYAPPNSGLVGLDYLGNAGVPGDWWGIVTNPPETGVPYIQGKTAPAFDASTVGFYVSPTTYERPHEIIDGRRVDYAPNHWRRYLNSETDRFVVIPARWRKKVAGVALGCRCVVRYAGKEVEAVAGDVGPDFGEGSIALARALGIKSNPRDGGVPSGVEFRFYPGQAAKGYELKPA